MLKLLIAVKSCASDITNGANAAIRETWGAILPTAVDLRFFVGTGDFRVSLPDEVRVAAPDDYASLPAKTRAILRWSLAEGYDYTFLCDTDTYVRVPDLLSSGFAAHDLFGYFAHRLLGRVYPEGWAWPSGGAGYWLSRRAAEAVVAAPPTVEPYEDKMVGQTLGPLVSERRIRAANHPHYGAEAPHASAITVHYCARTLGRAYDPNWMRHVHAAFGGAGRLPAAPVPPPAPTQAETPFSRIAGEFVRLAAADGRYPLDAIDLLEVRGEDGPAHTGRDYTPDYLLHCWWAASQLGKRRPRLHLDFGGYSYFAAIASAFLPAVEFYDIRKLGVDIPTLYNNVCDLMDLNGLATNSVESASCLHVLEHVGLGRYGDRLDARGDAKAAAELSRILAPGGRLLFVSPLAPRPRIQFNAHRIPTEAMALGLFPALRVVERAYIDGDHFVDAPPPHDFTGCFVMEKR